MRGKAGQQPAGASGGRITPAYAGKSFSCCQVDISRQDHPRLCGEKVMLEPWHMPLWGSPPPMRGKGAHISAMPGHGRITPAYAGKSRRQNTQCVAIRDHPRLCGEKSGCVSDISCGLGSPPPMRGKDVTSPQMPCPGRITPAYAGKSSVWNQSLQK